MSNNSIAYPPEEWQRLLILAHVYGWYPDARRLRALRSPPRSEDIPAVLTDSEAHQLAKSLQEALADIPNHDARTHRLVPVPWACGGNAEQARVTGWLQEDEHNPLNPWEYFSGDERAAVLELIRLCKRGGVRVCREDF